MGETLAKIATGVAVFFSFIGTLWGLMWFIFPVSPEYRTIVGLAMFMAGIPLLALSIKEADEIW